MHLHFGLHLNFCFKSYEKKKFNVLWRLKKSRWCTHVFFFLLSCTFSRYLFLKVLKAESLHSRIILFGLYLVNDFIEGEKNGQNINLIENRNRILQT